MLTPENGSPDRPAFHTRAYACIHVLDGHPVLLVSRPDGDWCFLCGGLHEQDASQYRVVGLGHLVVNDATLEAVLALAGDWEAERVDRAGPWTIRPVPADER